MANIRCQNCGRVYRYETEGCCPGCGAYNRPPKRERINADGTVQHMTDAAYEKRQHNAREKVCFEEKECHEDKARGVRLKPIGGSSIASSKTAPKKRQVGCLGILVILATLIGLITSLGGVVRSVFSHIEESDPPAATENSAQLPDEETDDYEFHRGDVIVLDDGSEIIVMDWRIDSENNTVDVELHSDWADSDHDLYASLVVEESDGTQSVLDSFDMETVATGEILHFDAEGIDVRQPLTLLLEEWQEDTFLAYYDVGLLQ